MSQFSAAGVAPNGTPVRVLFGWDHTMGLWADVYDPSIDDDIPFVEYYPQNVDELKAKLIKMQEENPELEYRFFPQEEATENEEQPSNKKIFEKLEALERSLTMIFDGHVLIGGSFHKIPNLP